MDLREAQTLAQRLMNEHGLGEWTFKFDRARRRFGSCRASRKLITLSRSLTLLNTEPQVRDTILHEIAHGLAPRDGHGAKWKAVCVRIGAKPVRCYSDSEVIAPLRKPARYLIGCRRCGWWHDRRVLNGRQLVCRDCREPVTYQDKLSGRHFRIKVAHRRRLIELLDSSHGGAAAREERWA
jgi:predicted SprT family Zn-dependent metalloprotease